jgi:hypothetical protein
VKQFTTDQRRACQERATATLSGRQQAEENNMQGCTTHPIAVAVAIAAALSPAGSAWAASEPRFKLAMPTAPEETVYRPECPGDEVSSAWLPCQVAGVDGNYNRR